MRRNGSTTGIVKVSSISSGREIRFYYPMPRFPSASVTGGHCELNCKHCGAHYLGHMPNVDTPEKLKQFCLDLEAKDALGLLVSGGSDTTGRVQLKPFIETLSWVKENTGLILNLHTGMLNREEAEEISSTGIDIASIDIVGSEDTLKEVYGLEVSLDAYTSTLNYLVESGVPQVAPHICIGLNFGKLKGEYRALDIAGAINPETIVFLGLIPTAGTEMENVAPPAIDDIVGLIVKAKEDYPSTEVSLGCMRDRVNKPELEWRAIEAGLDRLALPTRSTVKRAVDAGYYVIELDGCCAIPRSFEYRTRRLGAQAEL